VYAYAAGHALGDVDEAGDFNVLASLTNFSNSDSGATNYVVQVSDTLASIAQAVYGNASLAYIIAAANSLGTNGPAMLVAGSTLVIPEVLRRHSELLRAPRVTKHGSPGRDVPLHVVTNAICASVRSSDMCL
jgi:hypothetical protein